MRPVPLAGAAPPDDAVARWDGASVHRWEGTYGDYLLGKVGKVFPELATDPHGTTRPRGPDVGEAAVGEAARVTSGPRRRGPSGGCVRSRPAPRDP